jgi:hypothetical protein
MKIVTNNFVKNTAPGRDVLKSCSYQLRGFFLSGGFYSAGTVENTGGAINKTSAKKHKAVKPEAYPIAFGVGG